MPVSLAPLQFEQNRRAFLRGSLALGAGTVLGGCGQSEEQPPVQIPHPRQENARSAPWYAWLADTHIATLSSAQARGQNMAANLDTVVAQILAEPTRPRAVFIDGDLALEKGETGDYTNLVERLRPLLAAAVPVHMTLGNHDDRDAFREVVQGPPLMGSPPARIAKHIDVVQLPGFRVILLDPLDEPNVTPGVLGPEQLAWLESALGQKPDMPTVLFVHHNLAEGPNALTDTEALCALVEPRRQVKAIVFGHTHRWEHEENAGIHWLNLPAVGYPFDENQPIGWCRFDPLPNTGARLTLRAIGGDRAKDGETRELTWRDA